MTGLEKQTFEKWFEEKKEKCEVYGNGDDFLIDDEIKKFCLMGYELGLKAGAEFGYNNAKKEMQVQDYSMSYENGIFKCKYKSGKEFESVDGKTWKEIVVPKEIG